MKILNYLTSVLENLPSDWLYSTTHRLDIYNERLAKKEFLEQFNELYNNKNSSESSLKKLPTAYDYIRLGHPLSCILEWTIKADNTFKCSGWLLGAHNYTFLVVGLFAAGLVFPVVFCLNIPFYIIFIAIKIVFELFRHMFWFYAFISGVEKADRPALYPCCRFLS